MTAKVKTNPFEFEAAIRFTPQEMVDYFIDDHNFARFIHSQRNIFLLGDRGTGKTMMLRNYSLPIQVYRARRDNSNVDLSQCLALIGIYIPCRNTVLAKPEPTLLEPLLGRLMSEHLVIVSVVNALAEALLAVPDLVDPKEEAALRSEIDFILQWKLPENSTVCQALKSVAMREAVAIQNALNMRRPDSYYENAVTFATAVLPLIHLLTAHVGRLKDSHFSFMFDDAEALTDMQNASLNTWIASRDSAKLSFKVATSLVDQKALATITGGELLERHDFIRVNMEQDFQSSEAAFHKLAVDIVERRLAKVDVAHGPQQFFPMNAEMAKDLAAADAAAKQYALVQNPDATPKQVRDYVYKFGRAFYFRSRSSTANRPPYSGFDLIVHVSTGVIRYLLEPCYEMYDAAISSSRSRSEQLDHIAPAIQTERLEALSKRRWDWIKQGFNNSVRGCTRDDAKHILQLLEHLSVLLTFRLHNHKSEPRAITFSISGAESFPETQAILDLFEIARRAQILFKRTSSGKDDGKRVDYYTFDRLLWIDRGLDPVGQNACISIEARFLWEAAFANRPFPTSPRLKKGRLPISSEQPEIFEVEDHE